MLNNFTVNDFFPDYINKGIFYYINQLDVPWKDSAITSNQLDLLYHGQHSGRKLASSLLKSLNSPDDYTENDRQLIAQSLYAFNANSWTRLYSLLSIEYDPIQNYSMIEKMKDNTTVLEHGKTITREDNLTHAHSGTDTLTPNTTDTVSNTYVGFNGSATATGGNTDKRTGTETQQYNSQLKDTGTETYSNTGNDKTTNNYELSRSGNVGVTTSQQMATSEIQLWNTFQYFRDVVFKDIDAMLALSIY